MHRYTQERMLPTLGGAARRATPAGTRAANRIVTTKCYVTACARPGVDNTCIIPAGASPGAAENAALNLYSLLRGALEDHFGTPAAAAARMIELFPAGRGAFTAVRDGGRPTGQIGVAVIPSEALNVCRWLRSLPEGFIAVTASGPGAFAYNSAVVLERLSQGSSYHRPVPTERMCPSRLRTSGTWVTGQHTGSTPLRRSSNPSRSLSATSVE